MKVTFDLWTFIVNFDVNKQRLVTMVVAAVWLGLLRTAGAAVLPDGAVLRGVEGRLLQESLSEPNAPAANRWFFEFAGAVICEKVPITAGTKLEVLPCAVLEQMARYEQAGRGTRYRIWARVTTYRGSNFLFPTYFLPVPGNRRPQRRPPRAAVTATAEKPGRPHPNSPPVPVNQPNDVLTLPPEVIAAMNLRRGRPNKPATAQVEDLHPLGDQVEPPLEVAGGVARDYVLSGRLVRLEKRSCKQCPAWIRLTARIEGLGWKLTDESFGLLPCNVLEQAEATQIAGSHRPCFKLTGVVTQYKGQKYVLPERLTRVYSYGNFTR